MKKTILLLLLFFSFNLSGDESNNENGEKNNIEIIELDGSGLFSKNCLGCHTADSFSLSDSDEMDVEEFAEVISYYIYSPEAGMSDLSILSISEIEKIAHFLIFGEKEE